MIEGEIRQLAGMYAFVAKMHAVNADIEGMKALNQHRLQRGETIAYTDTHFYEAAYQLNAIAKDLEEKI